MTIATLKTEIKDLKNALNTPLDEKLKAKLREQLSISEKTLAEMESAKTPTAKKNATKKANVVAKKSTSVLQKIKKANKKVEPKKATPKKATTTKKPSVLQQLKSKIKLTKNLSGYKNSGIDLVRDSDRPALPMGRRISKNGNVYYENRLNRVDIKQPPKRYPKLADGGMMAKGGEISEIKLYYTNPIGSAEFLCSDKVEGTNEGSIESKYTIRFDGAKKYGGEMIIKPISHGRLGKHIHLYYHKTSGGAEYLCSAKVGNTNEGSMRAKYVVRIDGAKKGSEMIIKGDLEYRETPYADGGMMAKGGKVRKGKFQAMFYTNEDDGSLIDSEYFNEYPSSEDIEYIAKSINSQYVEIYEDRHKDDSYDSLEETYFMAKGGLIAVRNEDLDENSEIDGRRRYAVEIQDEESQDVLDYEYFNSEKEAEDFISKYKKGGRLKSAIMRDRAYKSNEPHEQAYTRKSRPKNPKYNYGFFADGGETEMHRAYAMGGVLQHGLETGDFIVSHDEGKMVVMNGGSKYEVNIHSGSRTKID